MAEQRSTSSPLPLWVALAPALTAIAMIGRLTSDRDGVLPRWVEGLVLVGALALVALPFVQRLVLKRRR